MNLLQIVQSQFGKYVISIMLGLGLATLLRRSCKDRKCMMFVPPDMSSLKEDIYEYDGKCYKYEASSVACNDNKIAIQ
jgi:hypothetical protein